jgi:predicted small lipoprotein YifL
VGEAARKTAKIGLIIGISLQFHGRKIRAILYGAARIGDVDVVSHSSSRPSGWAAIALLCAAVLALAACGRKGGLDLPPNSNVPTASAVAPAPTDTEQEAASKPSVFNPTYGADGAPVAPKGSKKPFILDPLLGN